MTDSKAAAVKQCDADPAFNWLRTLLSKADRDSEGLTEQQWALSLNEGMAPLLVTRASAAPAAVREEARQLAMRELSHQQALSRLAERCAVRDIRVMVIKGEALARSLYPAPGLRARADIDLWVESGQLSLLETALNELGYPALTGIRQHWARFEVVHAQASPPSVAFDIHIQPFFRPRMLQQRPFALVWADAMTLDDLAPLRVPGAFDAFLISALHLAKNAHKRWIWLYDLDRFCALHPQAVTEACARAPEWGFASLVSDALERTVQVFDTQLPCPLPTARGMEPLASMLNPAGRLANLRRDLSVLPGWQARFLFLRELLAKPR